MKAVIVVSSDCTALSMQLSSILRSTKYVTSHQLIATLLKK